MLNKYFNYVEKFSEDYSEYGKFAGVAALIGFVVMIFGIGSFNLIIMLVGVIISTIGLVLWASTFVGKDHLVENHAKEKYMSPLEIDVWTMHKNHRSREEIADELGIEKSQVDTILNHDIPDKLNKAKYDIELKEME